MTDATTPEPQRVTVELHEHSGEYGAGCMGCGKRLIEVPEPAPGAREYGQAEQVYDNASDSMAGRDLLIPAQEEQS